MVSTKYVLRKPRSDSRLAEDKKEVIVSVANQHNDRFFESIIQKFIGRLINGGGVSIV